MSRQRWAVFVYDPEGAGEQGGYVVGPFYEPEAAQKKAEQIERAAEGRTYGPEAEYIVLPVVPGARGANAIVDLLA